MIALIQSDKCPSTVDEKMDEFFKSFEETLTALTPEQFTDYIEGLAVKKLEKPKRLAIEAWRYWSEIRNKQYHFRRSEAEVDVLRKLTKEDVVAFYKKHVSPESNERKKLTVVVLGKDAVSLSEGEKGTKWNVIKDILEFQSAHALYEHILPYNDVPLISTDKYEV